MRISFHGAAREVTGSCHLVEWAGRSVLLDCGMIQGGSERHERNREPFPFPIERLSAVILSHAHIDHSGRLPLLCRAGYRGPILATEPTVQLSEILLTDSGHIQEEDARWKAERLRRAGQDASWVRPLYTEEEARAVLEHFVAVPFDRAHSLDGGTVTFRRAGHMLGAAIVELVLEEQGTSRRVTFSGDLGVDGARLLDPPQHVACPDYLLIESTYGDRVRPDEGDLTERLREVIERTIARGGNVVIPAFAVGRTQAILARLNDLVESGRLRGVTFYVDSPMAAATTAVFARYPEAYSRAAQEQLRAGDHPFEFHGLQFTRSVEESKAISARKNPAVILSAAGMCTAGRIRHHLKNNLSDARNTVLFVGYQAEGTLGRVIQEGTNPVRIFDEWYPVRASIEKIEGFSAHADRDELLEWYAGLGAVPRETFVVHGEDAVAHRFAATLRERFRGSAQAPGRHQRFDA